MTATVVPRQLRSIDETPTRAVVAMVAVAATFVVSAVLDHPIEWSGALLLLVAAIPWVRPSWVAFRPFAPALVMLVAANALWGAPGGVQLDGVIQGLLTALLAVGIVIVYRANRIVNFAQAEMGAVPANLAFLLFAARGWNVWLSAACGLAAAILLGVLVEFLFLRRFFRAPRLIATVATIGVAQLLVFLSLYLPNWIGESDDLSFPPLVDLEFSLSNTNFNGNDALVLIAVPVLLLLLAAFFRFTRIGIALRASAESADRASLLGIPVRRLQSVVWGLAGLLAFIALFLRIGVVGTTLGRVLDPVVLIAALGAAVIGRMERLPTTVSAAVGLGIISQSVRYAWNYDAARPAVIAVVIGIALLVQQGGQVDRLRSAAISSWQESREVRPVPAELRHDRNVVATQWLVAALVGLLVVLIPLLMSESRVRTATTIGIYAVIGISLVVLTGWAGQVSLGQMAFAGVGAAFSGWFATHVSEPFIGGAVVVLVLGGIAGAIATVVIGLPTLRARGLTFAVMTLAFSLATTTYLLNAGYSPFRNSLPDWLQGGERVPRPAVVSFKARDIIPLDTETRLYWFTLAVLAITIIAARGLRATRTGRVLIGVRENERAAQAYSIRARNTLALAFAISGFLAGVAGALLGMQQRALDVGNFSVDAGLQVFAMVVVGGLGSIGGAVIGALYVYGVQYWLPPSLQEWRFFATGAGMLLVLLVLPGGLGAALGDARDGILRWYARRKGIRVPSLVADTRVADVVPTPEMARAVAEAVERPEVGELAEMHE
jgi:branched-chain amino acid transport system permease protein